MNNLITYLEAKFQKPEIYYHVTSPNRLRSILKQGLIANPRKRTYPQGEQATYGGIYFTKTLNYALNVGAPEQTDKLIIVAQLSKGSLVHDEDYIVRGVEHIASELNGQYDFNSNGELGAYLYYANKYGLGNEKQQYIEIKRNFINKFTEHFKNDHFRNKQLITKLFDNYFLFNYFVMDVRNALHDKPELLIKKVGQEIIEQKPEFRTKTKEAIDALTVALRNSEYENLELSRRILIDKNITFSGNNKIIQVIEYRDKPKKLIIHYDSQNKGLMYVSGLLKKPKLKIENGKHTYIE